MDSSIKRIADSKGQECQPTLVTWNKMAPPRRWSKALRALFMVALASLAILTACGSAAPPHSSATLAAQVSSPVPTLTPLSPSPALTSPPLAAPTDTVAPTVTLSPSETPTALPTVTPTPTLKAALSATRPATRRPLPTRTATMLPPLLPEFNPAFPEGWPRSVHFTPANVAPGQLYWRLASAVFCDVPAKGHEHEETCPDYPGGMLDHTVYVVVLDEGGGCASNVNILHEMNTGDRVPLVVKHEQYPWASCATDYQWTMYGEGNDFWLADLPSDRIGGLVLNSPQLNWAENRAHVRYFLIFQRTTR
jgi:hypothetical protein